MNIKVDEFILSSDKWQKEMEFMRTLLLDCGLKEEFKWKQPCYSYQNKNIAIIAAFKDYIALSFFKGVMLKDTANILVPPGPNSQSVRMAKYSGADEILAHTNVLKEYVFEAIEVEKAGLEVPFKKERSPYPNELQREIDNNPEFKTAFESLTPGRQRAYLLFFSSAKKSATLKARIEKYRSRILSGKGINDCICGLSNRLPNCDGSHKILK